MVALRSAKERWAPSAALANEDMHHDRRLWQAPSIAEVAAVALEDFDAAMQDGHDAFDGARARIRRYFGCEPDLGECASSLVPRLQAWLHTTPPDMRQSLLLEAIHKPDEEDR